MSVLTAEKPQPQSQVTETEAPAPRPAVLHYRLRALREPSVLSRVIEMFALRDLIPDRVECRLGGADGQELLIDVVVQDLDVTHGEHMAQRMRNIVPVTAVMLDLKP